MTKSPLSLQDRVSIKRSLGAFLAPDLVYPGPGSSTVTAGYGYSFSGACEFLLLQLLSTRCPGYSIERSFRASSAPALVYSGLRK